MKRVRLHSWLSAPRVAHCIMQRAGHEPGQEPQTAQRAVCVGGSDTATGPARTTITLPRCNHVACVLPDAQTKEASAQWCPPLGGAKVYLKYCWPMYSAQAPMAMFKPQ